VKPRIAIPLPQSRPDYVKKVLAQYTGAIESAGGEPVPIPLDRPNDEIARFASYCHAVLLPGSPADIDPEKYGEAARHPKTAAADAARDNVDELLLQDAYHMRKPILGICYGMQSLNVWRTGSLVQHIESAVKHDAGPKVARAHQVSVEPDSRLVEIVGAATLEVNSSHHQAVAVAGDGLRVVARCPNDGVIEAVEGTSPEHVVMAVQWHPERMVEDDAAARALFRALIAAAEARFAEPVSDFESLKR
jgi:putative glutamine amidotransferase